MNSYGKSDGRELNEQFLAGNSDSIDLPNYGGDWDEPTGREVIISDYESELENIERSYKRQVDELNKLFGKTE